MKKLVLALLLLPLLAEAGLRLWASARGLGADQLEVLVAGSAASDDAPGDFSVRSLVVPSRHDEIVYELKPGLRGNLNGMLVHTNAIGFRGRERETVKPPGTYRIIGLGDAQMFGMGVAEGQTYLDVLERRLNSDAAGGRRYEALNLGAPGYNTAQEVAVFEHRTEALAPDLVVVHFVGDDFAPPRFLQTAVQQRGTSPLFLVELARALSAAEEDDDSDPPSLTRLSRIDKKRRRELARFDYMDGEDGFQRSLERLAGIAAERDVPVIFMMLGAGALDRAEVRDRAAGLGFQVLNALPYFHDYLVENDLELSTENWKGTFFLPDDQPSPVAHRVYARALLDALPDVGTP